jgi:L-2-hydroxyglutarate oxidase LhgO
LKVSQYDFLIVGSGIIGLTVANELSLRYPAARIAILEKESGSGMHASGRNSGVLHSGIFYASDTLKAQVCAKGAAKMREFAKEYNIPCEHSGKIIIPASDGDLPTVDRLLKNARDNNIRAERLDARAIREIEPHANPYQMGIYSPDTAVIDSKAVVEQLQRLLNQKRIDFHWNCKISDASAKQGWVSTLGGRFSYGYLFNCAGAYADIIAKMFGLAEDYVLVPFKGIYHKLAPKSSDKVRGSIYPVPDVSLPFLGVHLTRLISGEVYAGPTAIPALGRENYGLVQGIRPVEAIEIVLRLASLYLGNPQNFRHLVHIECRKYQKSFFLKAVQRLVPSISLEDLVPTVKSGIRPQLVNLHKKRLETDHILERSDNSIHVLNAISPAFTSSFAFAELIVDRSGVCI